MTTFATTRQPAAIRTGHRPRRLIRARIARVAWWLLECGMFAVGLALIVFAGGFLE